MRDLPLRLADHQHVRGVVDDVAVFTEPFERPADRRTVLLRPNVEVFRRCGNGFLSAAGCSIFRPPARSSDSTPLTRNRCTCWTVGSWPTRSSRSASKSRVRTSASSSVSSWVLRASQACLTIRVTLASSPIPETNTGRPGRVIRQSSATAASRSPAPSTCDSAPRDTASPRRCRRLAAGLGHPPGRRPPGRRHRAQQPSPV